MSRAEQNRAPAGHAEATTTYAHAHKLTKHRTCVLVHGCVCLTQSRFKLARDPCFGLAFPGVAHPLSDAAATALFTVLRNTPQRVMASYALDAFVLHLRASSAPYDAVWKGTYVALARILVVQVL